MVRCAVYNAWVSSRRKVDILLGIFNVRHGRSVAELALEEILKRLRVVRSAAFEDNVLQAEVETEAVTHRLA